MGLTRIARATQKIPVLKIQSKPNQAKQKKWRIIGQVKQNCADNYAESIVTLTKVAKETKVVPLFYSHLLHIFL